MEQHGLAHQLWGRCGAGWAASAFIGLNLVGVAPNLAAVWQTLSAIGKIRRRSSKHGLIPGQTLSTTEKTWTSSVQRAPTSQKSAPGDVERIWSDVYQFLVRLLPDVVRSPQRSGI